MFLRVCRYRLQISFIKQKKKKGKWKFLPTIVWFGIIYTCFESKKLVGKSWQKFVSKRVLASWPESHVKTPLRIDTMLLSVYWYAHVTTERKFIIKKQTLFSIRKKENWVDGIFSPQYLNKKVLKISVFILICKKRLKFPSVTFKLNVVYFFSALSVDKRRECVCYFSI